MTEAVKKLLEEAKELDKQVDNPELKDAIEALEYLGEDAKGNSQEYKDLKEVVEQIKNTQSEESGEAENTQNTQTGDEDTQKDNSKNTQSEEKPKKKLKYFGIKQIGSLWYSVKDNYKKGFETADKCAEYFNKD